MADELFAPVTPGEMLREEFLAEYGLSPTELAAGLGVAVNRIVAVIDNRDGIDGDMALRLALYFGNSAEYWMNLQSHYDLKMARQRLTAEESERIRASRPV